jgi:hypothetical protein
MAVPEGRVHMAPDSDVSGQPVDIDLAVAEAGGLEVAGVSPSDDGSQADDGAQADDGPGEPTP